MVLWILLARYYAYLGEYEYHLSVLYKFCQTFLNIGHKRKTFMNTGFFAPAVRLELTT